MQRGVKGLMQQTGKDELMEIIYKIKDGGSEAFELLLNRYTPDLTAYVWKESNGVLHKADVEDIIQDTWLEA